jgi:hypothetical protein
LQQPHHLYNMEEALALFKQLYKQHHDVEVCIAELKRKGFSQIETVRVLTKVSAISDTKADEVVRDSLAWSK